MCKLDRVGLVDNRTLSKEKEDQQKVMQETCDMWHVIHDMWHVTCAMPVNSHQSTVHSQQSTINSQQSTVNSQQSKVKKRVRDNIHRSKVKKEIQHSNETSCQNSSYLNHPSNNCHVTRNMPQVTYIFDIYTYKVFKVYGKEWEKLIHKVCEKVVCKT